ncbi:MAG TPA: metal-dependent hydrolase [archaeon]|nr:metal-dependent hydrolase [archaeon]
MLPFAHIGIAVFFSTMLYFPALFAAVGALAPDIVDKALFYFGFSPCGRFIAHSVFFAPVLSLLVYGLTRKKEIALAVLLGSILHLVGDAEDFVPYLYPIVKYQFDCAPTRIGFGIFEIVTESLGLILISIKLIFNSKLEKFRDRLKSKAKIYINKAIRKLKTLNKK